MFIYRTQIRLKDTDATGVLYFSEQYKFALEAFEEFLKDRGYSWRALMESQFLFPVVHCEAEYKAPLMVGDELEVSFLVSKIGTSSITLQCTFRDPVRNIHVGSTKIVHVAVDRVSRQTVPIPDFLRPILVSGLSVASELKG